MGMGQYMRYRPVSFVLLLVSSKVRLNRFPCLHRLYPYVASNPSCSCFGKPEKLSFFSSPEFTWHCLVLFVTSLLLLFVCFNEFSSENYCFQWVGMKNKYQCIWMSKLKYKCQGHSTSRLLWILCPGI